MPTANTEREREDNSELEAQVDEIMQTTVTPELTEIIIIYTHKCTMYINATAHVNIQVGSSVLTFYDLKEHPCYYNNISC